MNVSEKKQYVFKGRYSECQNCKHFKRFKPSAKCVPCGFGQNYEPKENNTELDNNALMDLFARMNKDE
jgi:hypothetical protein